MPRNRLPPDDPREWLNRARSNLACAKACIPDAYLEDLVPGLKVLMAPLLRHGPRKSK